MKKQASGCFIICFPYARVNARVLRKAPSGRRHRAGAGRAVEAGGGKRRLSPLSPCRARKKRTCLPLIRFFALVRRYFMAALLMPVMMYFCRIRNRNTMGMIAITAPAMISL